MIVGIDLGTTNSLIGVMESGFPVLLADAEGRRLTPSVVHFPANGSDPLVGAAAARMRLLEPAPIYLVDAVVLRGREQIEEQLLAVSPADEIHFRTLQFDKRGIQTCKDASESQFDLRVRGANLTGQDLRIGITGGTKETEADQGRLLPVDFLNDHLVRRVGVRLIEHHTLVAGLFEYRREGHDADGRKAHDPDTAVFCACFSRKSVELWVANVDQEYAHVDLQAWNISHAVLTANRP
jgi:hypothetical protein